MAEITPGPQWTSSTPAKLGPPQWEKFRDTFKDQPDLINSTKPEYLPESFHLTTTGTEFDCVAMAPVRELPGVEKVTVVQPAMDGRPGAVIACA